MNKEAICYPPSFLPKVQESWFVKKLELCYELKCCGIKEIPYRWFVKKLELCYEPSPSLPPETRIEHNQHQPECCALSSID